MSRGIGSRQRLFLAGMAKMEDDEGACFYVWQIINSVGELGLADEAAARKARQDAAYNQYVEKMRAASAAGDEQAREWMSNYRQSKFMVKAMASFRHKGGAYPLRTFKNADLIANPSRTLALLEQRGLIKRHVHPGRGSYASLTDAGRIVGQQALEDLANASPTPVEVA
jgi:hypothetical protein